MKFGFGQMQSLFPKTDLIPRQIFVLKLLLIYVLLVHRGIFVKAFNHFPYLPFIPFLDAVPSFVFTILIGILLTNIIASLFNLGSYRWLIFLSGLILLILIASSKPLFSNSLIFVACLLILIGLAGKSSALFRIQIFFLYLGAAINKLMDPDWLNGRYFDYFFREVFELEIYASWVQTGELKVAIVLSVVTIFCELLLGILVLIPRFTRFMIVLGICFHGGMLVLTSGELSARFLYIMSAAYLLISGLRFQYVRIHSYPEWLSRLLRFYDFSDTVVNFRAEEKPKPSFTRVKSLCKNDALGTLFRSRQFLLQLYFLAILCYLVYPFVVNKIILPISHAL